MKVAVPACGVFSAAVEALVKVGEGVLEAGADVLVTVIVGVDVRSSAAIGGFVFVPVAVKVWVAFAVGVFVAVGRMVFVAIKVGTDVWGAAAIAVFALVCVGKDVAVAAGIPVPEPTIEPPPKLSKMVVLALETPHASRPMYPPLV
jgi:hypothetical protein